MKRTIRRRLIPYFGVAGIAAIAIIGGGQLYRGRAGYGLPYYARFTPDAERFAEIKLKQTLENPVDVIQGIFDKFTKRKPDGKQ